MPRAPKKYHYIYKTTNKLNEKFYVGMHSTDDLDDGYVGSGKYLWRSIRKHGKENFVVEKLEFFDSREALIKGEVDFVDKTFISNPLCMNLRTGGSGYIGMPLGSKLSEETRRKMSQPRTEEHRRNISKGVKGKILGIPKSKEHIEKMRLASTGKIMSEEAKKKMSDSHVKHWSECSLTEREKRMKGFRSLTAEQDSERARKTWITRHENSLPIIQYTKSDEFVKSWKCLKDIETELGFGHTNISSCCSGRRKSAFGFKWKIQL